MKMGVVGVVALLAGAAPGGTINFESQAATPNSGALTSLSIADGEGVTATITRTSAAAPSFGRFDVIDVGGTPTGWGERHLSPWYGQSLTTPATDKFVADFASPGRTITGIRFEFGDLGGSDGGGNARLQAWSGPAGTGTLLFDGSKFWNGNVLFNINNPDFMTFQGSGTHIASITFWGEQGTKLNYLLWDNLTITSEPESIIPLPHAGGMAMAGLGVLAMRRRRVMA